MIEKLASLWPEITLFAAACVVMIAGLSKSAAVRRMCSPLAGLALVVAGLLAWQGTPDAATPLKHLPMYGKVLTCGMGLLMLLVLAGTVDRGYEAAVARGAKFDPLRSNRAEFYAFFLFSLTGVMLCAGADDLVWLFLALELTSLPTYVMVAISSRRDGALESAVKYFFLGALGAAIFLYGFALIYGGTGTTNLAEVREVFLSKGINGLAMAGLLLSIVGICFKIAAVPMHFYTPDVYQGASASMAAFLAFTPKAAGFFSLMILLSVVGWGQVGSQGLPSPIYEVLWIIAVLTMTVGNTLAIRQRSIKRILAYSSIAHSGYMLVGLIAGPGLVEMVAPAGVQNGGFAANGLAAVLFYLMAYGVMNLGAFSVLAMLERREPGATDEDAARELDDVDELRGLCLSRPPMAGWIMVLSAMSLLGFPPLLGFFAKLPLFTSGISAGQVSLVIILGLNSAIAAFYYLRLAAYPLLEAPDLTGKAGQVRPVGIPARTLAGVASAVGVIVLAAYSLAPIAEHGARFESPAVPARPAAQADAQVPAAGPARGLVAAGAGQTPTR